jgi:uncharacterized protein YggE
MAEEKISCSYKTQIMPLIGKTLIITAVATFTFALISNKFMNPVFTLNSVTTTKDESFSVDGEAKINTVPDQAEVRIGINLKEKTVKDVQDKVNKITEEIKTKLTDIGIDKNNIKTDDYSLYPEYNWTDKDGRKTTGYTINSNLVVTIKDFEKLNKAVDLATQAGANQISGIQFTLSDKKQAEIEKQARKEAIADAKEKAQELAGLAQMKLGRIINIHENRISSQPRFEMYAKSTMDEGMGGAPTNIEPGSTNFEFKVTLEFETL